jgi:hypothetical protein
VDLQGAGTVPSLRHGPQPKPPLQPVVQQPLPLVRVPEYASRGPGAPVPFTTPTPPALNPRVVAAQAALEACVDFVSVLRAVSAVEALHCPLPPRLFQAAVRRAKALSRNPNVGAGILMRSLVSSQTRALPPYRSSAAVLDVVDTVYVGALIASCSRADDAPFAGLVRAQLGSALAREWADVHCMLTALLPMRDADRVRGQFVCDLVVAGHVHAASRLCFAPAPCALDVRVAVRALMVRRMWSAAAVMARNLSASNLTATLSTIGLVHDVRDVARDGRNWEADGAALADLFAVVRAARGPPVALAQRKRRRVDEDPDVVDGAAREAGADTGPGTAVGADGHEADARSALHTPSQATAV